LDWESKIRKGPSDPSDLSSKTLGRCFSKGERSHSDNTRILVKIQEKFELRI
jgi:hypothetical protein